MKLNLRIPSTDNITKKCVLDTLKKMYPNKDIENPQQYLEITEIALNPFVSLDNEVFVYKSGDYIIPMFPNLNIVWNLKYVLNIGDYCFYNYTKLKNSYIMRHCARIGKYAFYKTNVQFKHFIGYYEIGEHAFDGCNGLTEITTDILSPYMFANSSVKQAVIYDIKKDNIPEHCFDNCDVKLFFKEY